MEDDFLPTRPFLKTYLRNKMPGPLSSANIERSLGLPDRMATKRDNTETTYTRPTRRSSKRGGSSLTQRTMATATKQRRTGARSTSTGTVMANRGDWGRIPTKYMQTAYDPDVVNGFVTNFLEPTGIPWIDRSQDANPVVVDTAVASGTANLQATPSPARLSSAKMHDDLPVLPVWVVGVLTGMLSFGLVVAVVLYLANFPPNSEWLASASANFRRKKRGYVKVNVIDHDAEEKEARRQRAGERSFASATATGAIASRRRQNLSINTSQRYAGLGIALPGNTLSAATPRITELRRQSYDDENLRSREAPPMSPARFAWEALTAPIQSLSVFTPFGMHPTVGAGHRSAMYPGQGYKFDSELEDGTFSPSSEVDTEVYATPANFATVEQGPLTKNFFHCVGESVEHAAEKMARVLSDEVRKDPEDGLLLPVRDGERERGYEPKLHAVV